MNNEEPKMRVAMLSNIYKPISTGSTNQIFGLSREISKIGHEVHILTSLIDPSLESREIEDGVVINRLRCVKLPRVKIAMNFAWLNWITTPENVRKVSKYLVENRIQVIHVHNHMFDSLLLAVIVSVKTKVPICLTLHTIMQHNQKLHNLILTIIDRTILRLLVSRYVSLVIAPDHNMFKYATEALAVKKTRVIPYGVAPAPLVPPVELSGISQRYHLEGRKIILSVGHVNHLRNRIKLVQAIAKISRIDSSVLLIVIGDIADQRAVEIVEKLGLESNVKFLGIGTAQQISCWRVIASLETQWLDQSPEGFNSLGVASMEGMMAGNPVISVANIDTFGPGALKNYENVIVINPSDEENLDEIILDLLNSPEKLEAIGKNASSFAKANFEWSENGERHLRAYKNLIDEKVCG